MKLTSRSPNQSIKNEWSNDQKWTNRTINLSEKTNQPISQTINRFIECNQLNYSRQINQSITQRHVETGRVPVASRLNRTWPAPRPTAHCGHDKNDRDSRPGFDTACRHSAPRSVQLCRPNLPRDFHEKSSHYTVPSPLWLSLGVSCCVSVLPVCHASRRTLHHRLPHWTGRRHRVSFPKSAGKMPELSQLLSIWRRRTFSFFAYFLLSESKKKIKSKPRRK